MRSGTHGHQDVHAAATGVDELGGGLLGRPPGLVENLTLPVRGHAVGARPSHSTGISRFVNPLQHPPAADAAGESRIGGRGKKRNVISRATVGILALLISTVFWRSWTKCTAHSRGPQGECPCASSSALTVSRNARQIGGGPRLLLVRPCTRRSVRLASHSSERRPPVVALHTAIAIVIAVGLIIALKVDPVISLLLASLYLGLLPASASPGR